MFFELIRRNSRRSRKENGIFFASMIVSIAAFYIILSLENQDVIIFLKTMESDAVRKLLQLVPVLYGASLFIIFFLVYFASKYQFERRNHEFGIYLMMGLKRSKLFVMLMAEDILCSILSLIIGLPSAVALSEVISLVTARLVGLGIIGHNFSFSMRAAVLTVMGLFIVKFIACAILCTRIARMDVAQLLITMPEVKQKTISRKLSGVHLISGLLFLGAAYALAIMGTAWESPAVMGITVVFGICGTFFLFHGFSAYLEILMNHRRRNQGLHVFTFRQIQENVFLRSNSLAVSCLLLLMALCCFAYGISVGWGASEREVHTMDFTFQGEEDEIREKLNSAELSGYFNELYNVKVGMFLSEAVSAVETDRIIHEFNPQQFLDSIDNLAESKEKSILLNNFQNFTSPYLISLTGYNEILKSKGEPPIQMKDFQIAFYRDINFSNDKLANVLETVLKEGPNLKIDGENYQLIDRLYSDRLVVDRSITIMSGLIVTDKVFEQLLDSDEVTSHWNVSLTDKKVKEKGLMQSIFEVNQILDHLGMEYGSYLQNIGRQLFYVVASSYTTIYLAVIFLIIANTVIAVQFLMQQQKTGRRYQTLIYLGSSYEPIQKSARIQILWYFGLPIAVAAVSSIFGVKSLFSGMLSFSMKEQSSFLFVMALAVIALFSAAEYCYLMVVMKLSDKHILKLTQLKREE